MSYPTILKRIIPFFLTFAAGLLIASIFVPISAPNFPRFGRGSHKFSEYKRIKADFEELKRENCQMKKELELLRRDSADRETITLKYVPEVDLDVPPPKGARRDR